MAKNKTFNIPRDMYKAIKKYDHQQMNTFLTNCYMNGFKDGAAKTTINYDAMREVLLSVKGIGEAKADAIIERLKEVEKEDTQNE